MISRHLTALSFVLVGAFLVPGCGQPEGGACEIMADCAAGLDCMCQLGGSGTGRGICRPIGTTCTTTTRDAGHSDSGPRADTGPVDGGPDGGPDGGMDDGGTDAGPGDAGTDGGTDAGTEDAASVDAWIDAP